MNYIIGSARVDERGTYSGGTKGDQKQTASPDYKGEVSMQNFYVHKKGWYVLRPKNDTIAVKIANNMKTACNNKNIGYSQSDRYGVINAGVNATSPTNADCSSLVRACVKEASGKDPRDFNTSNEANVLEKSGLFNKRMPYTVDMKLYEGDVLVTKTKGHTVIVTDGYKRVSTPSTPPNANGHTQLNYKVNVTYTVMAEGLNIRTKKANQDPSVIPTNKPIGTLKKGDLVKCLAATRIGNAIWIYMGLDSKGREKWSCADNGTIAYIS